MKKHCFLFLALVIVSLFSCKEEITDGIIYGKYYWPPHYEKHFMMVGKVVIPRQYYVEDTTFYFDFYKITNGDTLTRRLTVSRESFYRFNYYDSIELKTD